MPFIPRLNDNGILNNPKWYSENPFYNTPNHQYGLPNCTCYAWGRFWELTGQKPTTLSTGDAEQWYGHSDIYTRSQTPVLGAIICWENTAGSGGHVAVVEEIHSDGSLTTSNSAYQDTYFYTETVPNTYYKAPVGQSVYAFQGFILPNQYANSAVWHAKNTGGYATSDSEAQDNAIMAYSVLSQQGWTLNAIAGLLGNIQYESGFNPWRWEGDVIQSQYGTSGYGLVQFTPATKYIGDSRAVVLNGYAPNTTDLTGNPNDGTAQLLFVDAYADYYATTAYNISYADFKISTQTPEWLASAWLYNYERPANPTGSEATRRSYARYWFDYLSNVSPVPVPTPVYGRKMPIWLMTNRRRNVIIRW